MNLTLTFNGHRVRMAGTVEQPIWVAKDACRVLGLHGAGNIARDIPGPEKGVISLMTPGGPQPFICVKEPGLYRLISRSRKPAAQRFQAWLFGEVLPCIRQHGQYPAPAAIQPAPREVQVAQALLLVGGLGSPTAATSRPPAPPAPMPSSTVHIVHRGEA